MDAVVAGAESADMNGDGMIDIMDIRIFAEVFDLELMPAFRAKLDRLEFGDGANSGGSRRKE